MEKFGRRHMIYQNLLATGVFTSCIRGRRIFGLSNLAITSQVKLLASEGVQVLCCSELHSAFTAIEKFLALSSNGLLWAAVCRSKDLGHSSSYIPKYQSLPYLCINGARKYRTSK